MGLIKIKPGAVIDGLDARMLPGLIAAASIYGGLHQHLVITSGLDGKHSPNSLHYEGLAVDLRTRFFAPGVSQRVADQLNEDLEDFDVIFEKDHIHMEYDPK